MPKTAIDGVLSEQNVPGLAPGAATVATGSAVDLRTAVLLDPSAVHLYGEHMHRRGSDISRMRPVGFMSADVDAYGAKDAEAVELDEFAGRPAASEVPVKGGSTAVSVLDVESAPGGERNSVRLSTTGEGDVDGASSTAPFVSPAVRKKQRRRAQLCYFALCWCFFLEGWNDGTTGPLLPTIQRYYNVGFAIVSLLFVSNACGFVIGAAANVYLTDRLGLGKVLVLGATSQLIAYALLSPAGPFPVMCIGFAFAGFGLALQNSQGNGFVGSLKDPASRLGILHASYGLGAFTTPLVATHFATQQRWSFHYLISLGISISNVALLSAAFQFKDQETVMAETGEEPSEIDTNGGSKYQQIMRLPAVHYLAMWTLIYVGVEVTLGGWIVTFIQQKRGGGANAGYISSGFFGGLMLGRVLLLWLNRKVGERRVMFIYAFLAIQFEVTVWVVPSLIENAVAVACVGLLLGPMYPIQVNLSKNIIPKRLFTGSVGWIAGVGQAGSAVLPFVTGVLASKFGITSLQPFIVSMMSTMVVIWAFVPRMRRVD